MGFASDTVEIVEVDGGDATVTIRKLSHASLDKAEAARTAERADVGKKFGGELNKAFREAALTEAAAAEAADKPKKKATEKERREARYDVYAHSSTLQAGVKSWTYERKLEPAALDDLDRQTAKVLHERIVDLACGPLDEEEQEAEISKG